MQSSPTTARSKMGFAKIEGVCCLARERGYGLAWVDTCCMDKSSSAELTENINAMYRYYSCAAFCVVYLSDLPVLKGDQKQEEVISNGADYQERALNQHGFVVPPSLKNLTNCRWFPRNWTLQELIAPEYVEFYDCDWIYRGKRDIRDPCENPENSWESTLAAITGISSYILDRRDTLKVIPAATKFSWAANCECTRGEDAAYSLMGL